MLHGHIDGGLATALRSRLTVSVILALVVSPGWAQEADHWRFRQFQVENDFFPVPYRQPGDRFYTNGIRVSLGRGVSGPAAPAAGLPIWLRPVRRHCGACRIFPNLSFGQKIFTPEDIENPDPQPGERPWAAWLYTGFGAAIDPREGTRHDVEIQIGVTGNASGGELAQKSWHRLINAPAPRGWDNQFGPDVGVNGYYNFQRILVAAGDDRIVDWDFVPSIKAAVGTMQTYAGVGGTFRIGRNISDFPYSPIRPSEQRVAVTALPNLEIYGFLSVDARAVAYNYFLQGSLFADEPYTVEPKRYVWDFSFGLTARFRRFNITYAIIRRYAEFERTVGTDRGIHSFGSLSFTVGSR